MPPADGRSPGTAGGGRGGHVGLGLAGDFEFTRALTDRPVKFSFTGPFSLSRRITVAGGAYRDPAELVRALARRLNAEARALADAGARFLQIDEPFLAGYPEQAALAVEAVNIVTDGVPATWALHVCYGNRYARPSWEGHYDFLFPEVLEARVDQLVLEFARKGLDDLRLIKEYALAVRARPRRDRRQVAGRGERRSWSPPGSGAHSSTSTPAGWSSTPTAGCVISHRRWRGASYALWYLARRLSDQS